MKECEITDEAKNIIVDHLKMLVNDLKAMEFPSWLTQLFLVDLSEVPEQYQQELCELQQDESVKTLFKIKGTMTWLSEESEKKYPNSTTLAREVLVNFPSSYLGRGPICHGGRGVSKIYGH